MRIKSIYPDRRSRLFFAGLFLLIQILTGCNTSSPEVPLVRGDKSTSGVYAAACQKINDSCISLLHSGDIVLRCSRDAIGQLFRRLNATDQRYSHAGIVVVEHGYPFVYHCIEDSQRPGSGMHRDSVTHFVAAARNESWGAVRYELGPAALDSMIALTLQFYRQRPAFDRRFDLSTDGQLYCTELIYKVCCRATADTAYIPLTHSHNRTYVGVDNLSGNKHAQTVCRIEYKQ